MLNGADLAGADLTKADLSLADLGWANLRWADLRWADLGWADLGWADLGWADLRWANLRSAELAGAYLDTALLSAADLNGATIGRTIFGDNDLSEVKGLETVQHWAPSTIGIDTIYLSQGKIPLAFLRGAGVPEILIEYLPALIAPGAIQFYSCFISYSTKEQEFADRLYADLQNKGVRCWFAPQNLQPGTKLKEQIDNAIRVHERLLLILSADSINSNWVKAEIIEARKREIKENKRVLFPVSIVPFTDLKAWEFFDADEGKDLAKEIREYYMPPDFSDWKNHDSYTKGLQNLLHGLKAEQPTTA
jgi:uncharacterized protein YjbI with pentapeptide repeats